MDFSLLACLYIINVLKFNFLCVPICYCTCLVFFSGKFYRILRPALLVSFLPNLLQYFQPSEVCNIPVGISKPNSFTIIIEKHRVKTNNEKKIRKQAVAELCLLPISVLVDPTVKLSYFESSFCLVDVGVAVRFS